MAAISAQTPERSCYWKHGTEPPADAMTSKEGAAAAGAKTTPEGRSPFWRQCQKQKKGEPTEAFSSSDCVSQMAKVNKEPGGRGVQEMRFTQAPSLSTTDKVQAHSLYRRMAHGLGERT